MASASAAPAEHNASAVHADAANAAADGCGLGADAELHAAPLDRGAASGHEPPEKRRRTAPTDAKQEAEVEVVDLCDSDDDAPVAPPARPRGGGGGGMQSCASDDEVVFVDVSAFSPELLARWETESQQRKLRRLQKRASVAPAARASAQAGPAEGGLSGPSAACRDYTHGGGAPQGPRHGQGTWAAVADDWRRRNATGMPPPEPAERRTPKPASSRGTDSAHWAGAAKQHAMGSMPWQHSGGGGGRDNVAGHASHTAEPSEQDACDALRSRLVAQLQRLCAGCASFGAILAALGAPPQGWPWSTDTQLRAAFRAAALKYHPDRSQGEPMADRVWKEEVFKLLARAKAEAL